jgi:hypothetical protein
MFKVNFTRDKKIKVGINTIGSYWGNRGYLKGEAVTDFGYSLNFFEQAASGGEYCSYVSGVKKDIQEAVNLIAALISEYQQDSEISHFTLSHETVEDDFNFDDTAVTEGDLITIVKYLYENVPLDLWYQYFLTEWYGTDFNAAFESQRLTYWLEDALI